MRIGTQFDHEFYLVFLVRFNSDVAHIFTEQVFKKKLAGRWVSRALTETQKQTHLKIVQEHLKWFRREGENFFNQIIAIDETWLRDFEPELKFQSNDV